MTPNASCPRCQTVVAYAEGTRPACPACGYPGPDRRVPPAPWTPPVPGVAAPTRTSGKAVAALVLGVLGILTLPLGFPLAIAALVLGILARREVRAGGAAVEGNGMAVAGIVLGAIALALGAVVFAAVLFVLVSDLGGAPSVVPVVLA